MTAFSKSSPSMCRSSMKSKSTIEWLTITPTRLATPRKAMKPKGSCMTQSAAKAPTIPYGAAASTSRGLIPLLNWKTRARINHSDRDHHHPRQILEPGFCLVVLASDLHFETWRKRFFNVLQLGH